MSKNEMKEATYTVRTTKLAIQLASSGEGSEQILRVLASIIYGTPSEVKAKDLLHCLAEVMDGSWPKELETWIEGGAREGS